MRSLFQVQKCDQTVNMERHKKAHICHEAYCKTCKDYFSEDHQCYMQPVDVEDCLKSDKTKKDVYNTYFSILSVPRVIHFDANKDTLRERTANVETIGSLGAVHFSTDLIYV